MLLLAWSHKVILAFCVSVDPGGSWVIYLLYFTYTGVALRTSSEYYTLIWARCDMKREP